MPAAPTVPSPGPDVPGTDPDVGNVDGTVMPRAADDAGAADEDDADPVALAEVETGAGGADPVEAVPATGEHPLRATQPRATRARAARGPRRDVGMFAPYKQVPSAPGEPAGAWHDRQRRPPVGASGTRRTGADAAALPGRGGAGRSAGGRRDLAAGGADRRPGRAGGRRRDRGARRRPVRR